MSLPTTPFGSVCHLVNGKAFKPADWSDKGVPIIRIQNLNGPDKPFNFWAGDLEKQVIVETGDLLLAWSGTPGTSFGAHLWKGPNGVLNQHIFRCDLDKNAVTREWAKIAVNYRLDRLIQQAHGGVGLQHVTRVMVEELEIPLPPLVEQRRIAGILDRADELRTKRRATLAQLDELTQAIFLDMFGDAATEQNKMRQVQLSEVTTRITDGTHLTPKFIDSGVPFIFVKNVRNGAIDFQTEKFISEEEHATLYRRCPVEEGDVLYTTVGATYGQAASVGAFTKFAFQRHLAHLKPDPTKIVPSFLGTIMQLPIVKQQADKWARGVAQPTVNLKELREFVIPLPPLEQQHEFARRITAVENLKNAHCAFLAKLDELFASLRHQAFTGEL